MSELIDKNKNVLLTNISKYYEKSKDIDKEFGGPSKYFHIECIESGKDNYLGDRHIEMLYATLTAWGMHRMGNPEKTKTKLKYFKQFKESICKLKKELNQLRNIELKELDNNKEIIRRIFSKLDLTESNSIIVVNSKAMHHLLWDLIPPIDRQHTVRFFKYPTNEFRNKKGHYKGITLPNDKEEQFELFWKIVLKTKEMIFSQSFKKLNTKISKFKHKSKPKMIDDLIMTFVKDY